MKRFYGALAAGVALTNIMSMSSAAIEYNTATIDNRVYSYSDWRSGEKQCRMNINLIATGTKTDAVYWGYYPTDFGTAILEDADGNVAGKSNIFWRNGDSYYLVSPGGGSYIDFSVATGQHVGPFVLKLYDSLTASYELAELKAEVPLSNQTLIDAGGACAQIATGILNTAPIADAGQDIENAKPNHVVFLDGTSSIDEDDDDLTYAWRQIEGPAVTLDSATSATPTFIYPPMRAHEVITFELIVNDGSVDSDPAMVSVIHNGRSNGKYNE